MTNRMIATARITATALLMAGMSAPLLAQETMPSPETETSSPVPAMPPPNDPNAASSVGAVPSAAGEMVPADPSVPVNPNAPVGSAANPVVMGGNMTAPPPPPKDYPVCTKTITDSCVNRGEAKKARKR